MIAQPRDPVECGVDKLSIVLVTLPGHLRDGLEGGDLCEVSNQVGAAVEGDWGELGDVGDDLVVTAVCVGQHR